MHTTGPRTTGGDPAPRPRWFAERSPDDRRRYAQRFEDLAAHGEDVDGEARLIDAMVPRAARILDAGCGVGRVAAALARCGHHAVGTDADPVLIEAGRARYPELPLAVMDLWHLSPPNLAELGLPESYDLVVCTGNVLHFVADDTQARIVGRIASVLDQGGRAVFGLATGGGYPPDQLDADAAAAGLRLEHRFGTWQCDPFTDSADWQVAVFRAAQGRM